MIYCIVPWDLAPKLHEPLRRSYAGDPSVEVVVERRNGDRRRGPERRVADGHGPLGRERRRVRNAAGRRVAARRMPAVAVAAPELSRRARRYAERLSFVERVEPPSQELADAETARLVTRVQAGNHEAFNDLYLRHFAQVYAHLRLVLRDSHEAEDATQDVFVQVLKALPGYELRGAPFRTWLFRIVRNHSLNLLRGKGRLELEEPAELERRLDSEGEAEERALVWLSDGDLLLLVELMPLAQRQVVALRYMIGLSNAEIANVLARSPDAINQLHQRALRFLRKRLTSLGRTPESFRPISGTRAPVKQARVVRRRRFALLD